MGQSRRSFLKTTTALAVGAAVVPRVLQPATAQASKLGALIPDPNGILDLPAGFRYTLIDQRDDDMSDGYKTPGLHDGMGCFIGPRGEYILMRNHEVGALDGPNGPFKSGQRPPDEMYNEIAMGGVTRVVVDPETGEKISSNLVLGGTIRNCAGGTSPWGWLSCEESDDSGHGFVFLTKTDAESIQPPQRIDAYGRCYHEAVAIDPETYVAYLTEDRDDSCLYRMVPNSKDTPFEGKLQALKVIDEDKADLGTGRVVGDQWKVEWVDLDDPSSPDDTLRYDGQALGAAIIRRGEGIAYHDGVIYFCSTSGGELESGQIFKFTPATQELELIAQSDDPEILDMPDNICVAPWGDIYMSEDGKSDQYIRFLDADGQVQDFARNALSESELAGVCFSPDGRALFINIHKDHRTYMITGPFPEVAFQSTAADDASAGCSALGSQSAVLAPLAALAFRWATQKSASGQEST